MIRHFEIRDIPTLRRYRKSGLFLDSIPTLTWGRRLVSAGAVLFPLSAVIGVFTSLSQNDEESTDPIVAQVVHAAGSAFAHFTFVAPDSAIESPVFQPLLEHLIKRVGKRGAQSLVAEVNEKTHTFEALRRAHFSIYSRQRIWRMEGRSEDDGEEPAWRAVVARDEFNIRKLYNSLVPAMVQQVEPGPWGRLRGWVHYQDGDLLAFADVVSGPRGIWVQPFIHPEVAEIDMLLRHLHRAVKPRRAKPIYFCLRSYSAWLTAPMQDLGALPGPSQAVMVRRLTAAVKKPLLAPLPEVSSSAKATTPYTQPYREPGGQNGG